MRKNAKCINIFEKNKRNFNLYQISRRIILLITLLQISINLIKYTQLTDYISKSELENTTQQQEANDTLSEGYENLDTQKCNINLSELKEVCSIIGMNKIKSISSSSNQIEIQGICDNTKILEKLSNRKNIKNFNIKSLEKEQKDYLFTIEYKVGGLN